MDDILNYLDKKLLNIFIEYAPIKEMYLCGGCLREILIGNRPSKDWDIFVNCSKECLDSFLSYLRSFGKVDYGQYGSPRFYPYSNKDIYIDIVPFYNFTVSDKLIDSIEELLNNFDCTINALALNLRTGKFYNPVGGLEDLQHKIIKAVRLDFPEKFVSSSIPLSAVSVFWFRLLHYQNKLHFHFDSRTEEWIIGNKHRLADLDLFETYFFVPVISDEMLSKIR